MVPMVPSAAERAPVMGSVGPGSSGAGGEYRRIVRAEEVRTEGENLQGEIVVSEETSFDSYRSFQSAELEG